MNDAYFPLWMQALDVTALITAAGCLLWTFHKEVEAAVFTQRPYPSARFIGGVIVVIGVVLMNVIGIVTIPEVWIAGALLQLVLSICVAGAR
jgi:cbb3-type cytochrome oxidase subunit 1